MVQYNRKEKKGALQNKTKERSRKMTALIYILSLVLKIRLALTIAAFGFTELVFFIVLYNIVVNHFYKNN